MKSIKVALVLGSGGARGLAHIGVLKVLKKYNIPIDCIIGTSIGAYIGGFFAAGYSPEEIEQIAYSFDKIFTLKMLLPSAPKFGLIDTDRIINYLNQYLGNKKIEDSKIPYFAITTDLVSGEEVVFNSGLFTNAITASVAVPGLVKPFFYKNHYFVDGGLVNPLPVSVAYKLNSKIIIAVNVSLEPLRISSPRTKPTPTLEKIRRKIQSNKLVSKLNEIIPDNFIYNLLNEYQKKAEPEYPSVVQTILQSFSIMENRLMKFHLQYYPPNILINPHIQNFSMLEFYKAKELITLGEESTLLKIREIKKLLKNLP